MELDLINQAPFFYRKIMNFEEQLEYFRKNKSRQPAYYVLFESIVHQYSRETGESTLERGIFCLDVSGTHAHPSKIQQYLDKGWKLLEWKLPLDENGRQQKDNKLLNPYEGTSNFGDDVDHFEELNQYLQGITRNNENLVREERSRADKIQRELDEMKAKIASEESSKKSAKASA